MNRNGLEILKARLQPLEIDISLLSIYGLFITCYLVGKECFDVQFVKIKDDLIQLSCINYIMDDYSNSINYLLSEDELFEEIKGYLNKSTLHHNNGFIKIGYFDINDVLLLGVEPSNSDEIWILSGDWGDNRNELYKIHDNIFQFLWNCHEIIISMNLITRNFEVKNLFRNYNEDFWRIRE